MRYTLDASQHRFRTEALGEALNKDAVPALQEMLVVLTKLNEKQQFECRGVARRWRNLTQDPHLIRHSVYDDQV